jgi:hypothetical protein
MGRSTAAVIAAILSIPATAAIVATEADRAGRGRDVLAAPAVAPAAAGPRAACVWRVVFRPPSRLYYGCKWPDTLAASTQWIDLDAAQVQELAALAAAIATGASYGPMQLPEPAAADEPTQCDRYWLWATDEGARAPEMTRERKIAQACAAGSGERTMRGN